MRGFRWLWILSKSHWIDQRFCPHTGSHCCTSHANSIRCRSPSGGESNQTNLPRDSKGSRNLEAYATVYSQEFWRENQHITAVRLAFGTPTAEVVCSQDPYLRPENLVRLRHVQFAAEATCICVWILPTLRSTSVMVRGRTIPFLTHWAMSIHHIPVPQPKSRIRGAPSGATMGCSWSCSLRAPLNKACM